jgi:hypothetical protein
MSHAKRFVGGHGLVSRHVMAERAVVTGVTVAERQPVPLGAAADAGFVSEAPTIGGDKGQAFFDRMFDGLAPLLAGDDDLEQLANAMKEQNAADPALNNTQVPAGFTYLG